MTRAARQQQRTPLRSSDLDERPATAPSSDAIAAGRAATSLLSFAVVVLIALNALYMVLVAFGNVSDYAANHAFVQHVLSMDTTNFGAGPGTGLDPHVMWRAVTAPGLQTAAYLAIIVWEAASGLVLAVATVLWMRPGQRSRARATMVATAGLLMVILLFFGGFVVLGGEWFQMWRSTAWNGLDPAFRNSVLALLALVLVHLPGARRDTDAARG